MLTLGRLLIWGMLIASALLLSVTQAWAFAPGASRFRRHLVAWAVSTLGLAIVAMVILSWSGSARRGIDQTILVLAAITAAISLGICSWFGRRLKAERTTVRQRAFALFWPHLVVLGVLGALDMFVLYAAALSRIH